MQFEPTSLPDVLLITPRVFADDRGYFLEVYHSGKFAAGGVPEAFVQDNLSRSARNVVRGLHYQISHPQGKLVTVLQGAIFDVAVDLRRSSPSFGQWVGVELNSDRRQLLYIPPGFAHGFCVVSESADVLYKCTDLYHPEHERTVLWNDPALGIEWPLTGPARLSEKDLQGKPLVNADCFA